MRVFGTNDREGYPPTGEIGRGRTPPFFHAPGQLVHGELPLALHVIGDHNGFGKADAAGTPVPRHAGKGLGGIATHICSKINGCNTWK